MHTAGGDNHFLLSALPERRDLPRGASQHIVLLHGRLGGERVPDAAPVHQSMQRPRRVRLVEQWRAVVHMQRWVDGRSLPDADRVRLLRARTVPERRHLRVARAGV